MRDITSFTTQPRVRGRTMNRSRAARAGARPRDRAGGCTRPDEPGPGLHQPATAARSTRRRRSTTGRSPLGGAKWIDYDVEVACAGGRTIELDMRRWEADCGLNVADDLIGTSDPTRSFGSTSGWTWTVTGALPDNDGGLDQYSEMYQRVRFRVSQQRRGVSARGRPGRTARSDRSTSDRGRCGIARSRHRHDLIGHSRIGAATGAR